MKNIRLYPPVDIIGRSFKEVKKTVVPQQSMSLKEIIRRFVRRESLPISQEGFYEERLGDLEKLAHEDLTVQMERAAEIKDYIQQAKKRMEEKEAAETATGESGTPSTPTVKQQATSILKDSHPSTTSPEKDKGT